MKKRGFVKGDVRINRAGRPKGSRNKTGEEFRRLISKFLTDNWDELQTGFNDMKGPTKAYFIEKLLRYKVPEALNPERLTTSQLEQLYEYIKTKQDEQDGIDKGD
jgi:hypothetical protein